MCTGIVESYTQQWMIVVVTVLHRDIVLTLHLFVSAGTVYKLS